MHCLRFTVLVVLLSMTLPASAYRTELSVAADGSGDFVSIQAAINAAKSFPDRPVRISVGPGIYEEKVVVWHWNTDLSLVGAGRDRTVIRWNDHFDSIGLGRNSTFHTATLRVDANDFYASDLSIVNAAGPVGQAIALSVNADRVLFERVSVQGHQDSLYVGGEGHRVYFRDCYIEGTVDFIFGGALAVFEGCQVHSLSDSYITAASTSRGQAAGLVFIDCRLTAAPAVTRVYLGRPWRDHAQTVFLRCEMGGHIRPAGWHDWDRPKARKSVFYAEYESHGPGAAPRQRVSWSRQLDKGEAAKFRAEALLTGPVKPSWFEPHITPGPVSDPAD